MHHRHQCHQLERGSRQRIASIHSLQEHPSTAATTRPRRPGEVAATVVSLATMTTAMTTALSEGEVAAIRVFFMFQNC